MDQETRRKIEQTVTDILKKSNLEDMTEHIVRDRAQERLGIDLSGIQCKVLVRKVVESYLVSDKGKEQEPRPRAGEPEIVPKMEDNDSGHRMVCKLSKNRNVAIHEFNRQTLVTIRQYYEKDGKQLPSLRGISLPIKQWSALKSNIPAIEKAILQLQAKERSEHPADKFDAVSDPITGVTPKLPSRSEHRSDKFDAVSDPMTGVTPKLPSKTIRFVGKNYHAWESQMKFLLQPFKIAYVLSDQPPTAVLRPESSSGSAARIKAGEQKWKSDDDMCRHMILNSLSDSLFHQYSKTTMSARELWKELKMIHVIENSGTKRSKVKKYLEFRMVEEKSILKQVEELGNIATSTVSDGIEIADDFHVSAIISKLPPSWKSVSVKLMHEDHLSLVELIDQLRIEEHLRTQQNSHISGASSSRGSQHPASNHVSKTGHRGSQHPASNHVSKTGYRGSQHPASNHVSKTGHRGSQHPASNNVSKMGDPNSQSVPMRKREWEMEVKTVLCLNCGKDGHTCLNCPSGKL